MSRIWEKQTSDMQKGSKTMDTNKTHKVLTCIFPNLSDRQLISSEGYSYIYVCKGIKQKQNSPSIDM